MKINLKTTIFLSGLFALILNLVQFATSYGSHKDAFFAPSWAYSASAAASASSTPAPQDTPPPLSVAQPAQSADVGSAPTVSASAPSTDTASEAAARLSAAGLHPDYAAVYVAVQQQTGTPWQLLAAVHQVETGASGSTTRTSYAGATGPMQFMPATFDHYAVDGNGDGIKDIHNVYDALYTAGRYLAAGGAARGQYATALYHYNHSWSYVSRVTGIADSLGL